MTYSEIYKALRIKPDTFLSVAHYPISNPATQTVIPFSLKTIATDVETSDAATESEGRKYQYPRPKLTPDHAKKNELSEEEKLRLEYHLKLAKMALHEFKNLLRSEGIDVSNFDVSIRQNKLDYSKIPDQYRGAFEILLKNNLSTQSFKARGTHYALTPFTRQLLKNNLLAKHDHSPSQQPTTPPPLRAYRAEYRFRIE